MRKILKLVTMLLCVCVASACFSGCEKDLEGKIEISGDKITMEEANSFVEQRKKDYPQDSEVDLSAIGEWFNVDLVFTNKMTLPQDGEAASKPQSGDSYTDFKMKGKVGFFGEDIVLDVHIDANIDPIDSNDEEIYIVSGSLIFIDDIYYVDFIKSSPSGNEEDNEVLKQMGGKEILSEYPWLEAFEFILGNYVNCEYNENTFKTISLSPEGELTAEASKGSFTFYKAEDKIFAENKTTLFYFGNGYKNIIQYEFEFEKDSSLIKNKKVYTRHYMNMEIKNENIPLDMFLDLEILIDMQRIDPIVVVAPDLEGYEKVE